ncbi:MULTISPECIES: hypothetical protein [Streptomyces]|nr:MULTISPECIES: hypothetical protein [Streptomyces]MCX4433903.1 hypothetical protein [Streptomyces mirabilis]
MSEKTSAPMPGAPSIRNASAKPVYSASPSAAQYSPASASAQPMA